MQKFWHFYTRWIKSFGEYSEGTKFESTVTSENGWRCIEMVPGQPGLIMHAKADREGQILLLIFPYPQSAPVSMCEAQ